MPSAFILSPDQQLSRRLEADLTALDFESRLFVDADAFLEACGLSNPDLLVVHCADLECDSLIARLRESWEAGQSHILLVIDSKLTDRLQSLGKVDDIILADYEPNELTLRLRLILAKLGNHSATGKIQIGQMMIDPESYEVRIDNRLIMLTYREYELLRFLAGQRGRVFSRKTLVENIWQYDYLSGTRTVDVHVRRLRSKLGPQYGSLVETVRNVGYRMSRRNL